MSLSKLGNRRVNPARAGMIRAASEFCLDWLGKPRASGDDPRRAGTMVGEGR